MLTEEQLRAAIEDRRAKLEKMERGLYPTALVPRAYVVDVTNKNASALGAPASVVDERTMGEVSLSGRAPVEQNTIFYCKAIQVTTLVAGSIPQQPPLPGLPARFSLPGIFRFESTSVSGPSEIFFWKVRDTGSDREWQDDWLPSSLLMSGDCNPLMAGRAHAAVSGGSEIEVLLSPVRFSQTSLPPGYIQGVREWTFRFVMLGMEKRLG